MSIFSQYLSKNRVKTPSIFQMEVTECSAICLGIILAYYGKYVPTDELRKACNVTRDGSSALNIVKAANAYGLDAKGYTMEPEAIKSVTFPAIIFWEFEHFVVLEGYSNGFYYINDPATGPRKVTHQEFDLQFTGLVLEFSLLETFEKSGKPVSLFSLIYPILNQVKGPIFFILLCELGILIPALALPGFSQVFVDRFLVSGDLSWGFGFIWGVLLAIGLLCAFTFLQRLVFTYLKAKLSLSMSSKALWHLLRLPIEFFSQRYPGELAYRMTLIEPVVEALTGNLAKTVIDMLLIVVFGGIIAYHSPIIALIAFVAGICNIWLIKYIFRARQDDFGRYQAALGKSSAYSLGLIESIESIKAMGLENKFYTRWAGYYTKAANALHSIGHKDIWLGVVPPFINSLTVVALVAIGGLQVIEGKITVGIFVAMQILLANFMLPLMRLVSFSQVIQLMKINLSRLEDLMKYPLAHEFKEQTIQSVESTQLIKLDGQIDIKNIVYGYCPLDAPLLDGISISIPVGKAIALVGRTGSGKSTLTKLLAGFLQPWQGEIYYDSQPLHQIPRLRLTSSVSIIEQNPFIFRGTIRDNLSLLNQLVHQEELVKACMDACIHDEILQRVGGYDMLLEENGTNLSGGQRQRLEIARGLLKNPSILILDECTSALDPEVEERIIRNIHRRGCTIIMIAHRLSSIKNCDEIYVMENGHIVNHGPHETLKKESPIYAEWIEAEEYSS